MSTEHQHSDALHLLVLLLVYSDSGQEETVEITAPYLMVLKIII
jgi:hypothetical protein